MRNRQNKPSEQDLPGRDEISGMPLEGEAASAGGGAVGRDPETAYEPSERVHGVNVTPSQTGVVGGEQEWPTRDTEGAADTPSPSETGIVGADETIDSGPPQPQG